MQSKSERHAQILRLVANETIRTQAELKSRLEATDQRVDQATLSRDIKELGLIKVTIDGVQRYATQTEISTTTTSASLSSLSQFVRSIDYSQNIIVIKTDSGAANHVAESLDNGEVPQIIGTVAGDNTIFIVVSETVETKEVAAVLRKIVGH
jgi:Arginine repressor